jgi:hypothetical protein
MAHVGTQLRLAPTVRPYVTDRGCPDAYSKRVFLFRFLSSRLLGIDDQGSLVI